MLLDALLNRIVAVAAVLPLFHAGMNKVAVAVRRRYFPDDFTQ